MNKSDAPVRRRRGRPPGRTRSREQILAVARRRFLTDGYQGATLRSIAAEAGVDVALISYHFGSKKGLFGAALGLLANPPEVLAAALAGPPEALPERVLHALLATWDDPRRGAQLRAMVSTAVQEPDLARLLREVFERELFARVAEALPGPRAEARAAALGTQLAGVVFARYILRVEPVASVPADELIRQLLPAVRAAVAPVGRRRPPG